ncbi:CRAL-TRIO domain-containing protein [Melanogaster broomeanus]|nr:CRAL-TRIO domain-containing protein [Melanogaster broomeanus]
MAKTGTVLTAPETGTEIRPIHQYSEEQIGQIQILQQYAHSLLLPSSDPYHKWELRWLKKADTIPRYIRAAKWIIPDAQKRIKGTLEWRREYKPELIPPDEVKVESETGKIILNGFDKDGRPIIYMRPGRENTGTSPRQLRHLVWWLERAKDMMPPGQESLVIIVDYKSTTLRTNPSISVASKVLTILQQHYVETLGRAIVVNLPFLLNFFYKGIAPFLDPVTRDKMRFNPDLFELIPRSQLDADFDGDYEFEFSHESYWKQVIDHCGIAPDGTRLPGYFDGPISPQPQLEQTTSEDGLIPEVATSDGIQSPSAIEEAEVNEKTSATETESGEVRVTA